jgi:hypothetical protein
MRHTYRTALWSSLLFMAACGGDDGPSAPDQCVALVETTCHRGRVCAEEISGDTAPPDFESDCIKESQADRPCSKAQAVSENYDSCIDMLNAAKCAALFTVTADNSASFVLPAVCRGAILSDP